MKYGERSAEAVRMCVNARAALQSRVLTGLLPEQLCQLEYGWTRAVIETLLASVCADIVLSEFIPETFSSQESKLTMVMLVRRGKVCVNKNKVVHL